MKKLNKKGFTLIEIIVVIVVLAVLMAVSVPSVLKYINEADNAKYMAQGRSVMTIAQTEVIKAYVGDNEITSAELAKLTGTSAAVKTTYGSETDGMGKIESVYIYLKPTDGTTFGVTENNGELVIAGGTNQLSASKVYTTENLNIVGVECVIDGYHIVAIPNEKVYVGKK